MTKTDKKTDRKCDKRSPVLNSGKRKTKRSLDKKKLEVEMIKSPIKTPRKVELKMIKSNKVKSLINAFNENVSLKSKEDKTICADKNLIEERKIKDAFGVLPESAKGGTLRSSSPGIKNRRKIGSLKTPTQDSKQRLMSEWIGKRKV